MASGASSRRRTPSSTRATFPSAGQPFSAWPMRRRLCGRFPFVQGDAQAPGDLGLVGVDGVRGAEHLLADHRGAGLLPGPHQERAAPRARVPGEPFRGHPGQARPGAGLVQFLAERLEGEIGARQIDAGQRQEPSTYGPAGVHADAGAAPDPAAEGFQFTGGRGAPHGFAQKPQGFGGEALFAFGAEKGVRRDRGVIRRCVDKGQLLYHSNSRIRSPARSQLNRAVTWALPASPMRRASAPSREKAHDLISQRAGPLGHHISRPGSAPIGRPTIGVTTAGSPAAIVSRTLFWMPLAQRSGATASRASRSRGDRSSTNPASDTPGRAGEPGHGGVVDADQPEPCVGDAAPHQRPDVAGRVPRGVGVVGHGEIAEEKGHRTLGSFQSGRAPAAHDAVGDDLHSSGGHPGQQVLAVVVGHHPALLHVGQRLVLVALDPTQLLGEGGPDVPRLERRARR